MKKENLFRFLIVFLLFALLIIFNCFIEKEISKNELIEYQKTNNIDNQNIVVEFLADSTEKECFDNKCYKKSMGEFKLTAYCSCKKCCGKWALNRPKDENGKDIVYGSTGEILIAGQSIAVDPNVIPYGSELEINGQKYKAQDCGGAIKENRIDVYFDDHQSALEFGVQYAEVFLLVS